MVDYIQSENKPIPQQTVGLDQKAEKDKEFNFFGEEGMNFWDFVDIVNPLQHIPMVSTVYRDMSGDEIENGSRLIGGTLFGGPIGLAASTFNVILDHNTGMDAGEHVMAWFDGEETLDQPATGDTMFASAGTEQGEMKSYASYASFAPASERAAFEAGEASLRMADLYDFMNTNVAQEVPVDMDTPANISTNAVAQAQLNTTGAGSAGTWAPVALSPANFPTERSIASELTAAKDPKMTLATEVSKAQTSGAATASNYSGFQANQTHLESISALQAFARDVKAQQAEQVDTQKIEQQMRPQPLTTSQLSQTNSEWFASMMNDNFDRYKQASDFDRIVENVDP